MSFIWEYFGCFFRIGPVDLWGHCVRDVLSPGNSIWDRNDRAQCAPLKRWKVFSSHLFLYSRVRLVLGIIYVHYVRGNREHDPHVIVVARLCRPGALAQPTLMVFVWPELATYLLNHSMWLGGSSIS